MRPRSATMPARAIPDRGCSTGDRHSPGMAQEYAGGLPVPRVAALYRYPIKGFTPELCESLSILPSGRVASDRVIGDGATPRYHDSEAGQVTLHGRASVQDLALALGDAELSELRFRSNIAIEGAEAWAELGWVGRRVRIGALDFEVARVKVRCLA